MKVRLISALVAALTACVLLPATSSAAPSQGCDGSPNSDTGHGANQGGPYDHNCVGAPSGNGNGDGKATGKPCAGCVGNADDKNPGAASGKGQYPNGSDHNKGYECDKNKGIGQTNPAHTGCTQGTTVNPPPPGPQTCPDGSPMPKNGKCGDRAEKPPTPKSTDESTPPGQAVLGERAEGKNGAKAETPKSATPKSTPKSTTPRQEVLGENAAGGESPASGTAPASAQAAQAEPASSNKSLPFTGTDVIALLLAAGIALAGGLALRRLADHRA